MRARRLGARVGPMVALTGAVAVGAALRFARLRDVPPGLSQDEAVNAYDAFCLAHTGRDHHGHLLPWSGLESFGDWVSPLLTFLTAPAVGLWAPRVEVVRGVSAAVGTAAIPAVYRLGVEASGRRDVGVVAAWLLSLSPWHVHLSRRAIPPATVPTLLALTLATWLRAARRGRGLVSASVLAGLTVSGYPTMKVYVPLLGLAAAGLSGPRQAPNERGSWTVALAVFAALAGRMIVLSALDPARRARFDQVSVLRRGPLSAQMLVWHYLAYFSPRFLFAEGDRDPAHTPGSGNELRTLAPLLVAGLAALGWSALVARSSGEREGARLLLAALALAPVPGALTRPNPHTLRAAQLVPLLAVAEAFAAVQLLELFLGRTAARMSLAPRLAVTALAGAAFVGELFARYRDYFGAYAGRVRHRFQDGLEEALAVARAHAGHFDEIWIADASCAYIYVLLYERWPPRLAQRSLRVQRRPPEPNVVPALGRYRFGMPPDVTPATLALLATVRDPEGRAHWEVRGGGAPNSRRLLLIRRPHE